MNRLKTEKSYAKNREDKKNIKSLRADFIIVLKNEFYYRRTKDINYSLRRFASDLGLNPMHLCNILRNNRGLSRKKAELISLKLNISHDERRRFHLLVSAASARSKLARNLARMGLKNKTSGLQQRVNSMKHS